MSQTQMSTALPLSRDSFSTRDHAQQWFKKFATLDVSENLNPVLQQLSRMDLEVNHRINLAAGALSVVRAFGDNTLEDTPNPDAIAECARLFFRVDESFLNPDIPGGVEARAKITLGSSRTRGENFFVPALMKLAQEGHDQAAHQLLQYMANSSNFLGPGLPKIDDRGV